MAEYKLLYVAPERLMLSGFLANLQTWNINQIAIDEAHCISEWGHDFRPEYRQLARLRELLSANSGDGPHRDCHHACSRRHPQTASFARTELLRRQL